MPTSPEERLVEVRRKSFREQAVWFLNSSEAGDDLVKCDLVRKLEEKCASIESSASISESGEESVVDEIAAHRLLEFSDKPCTSKELRNFMETTGTRKISLAELLIFQFGYDWRKLVNKPECGDLIAERDARIELERVKGELDVITDCAKKAARAAEVAHQSEENALRRELAASKAAKDAQAAKIFLDKTKAEAGESLETLNLQEEATRKQRDELKSIASDKNMGIVSRNRAKTELSILLSDDPIMLRMARIKQEAAVKKVNAAAKKAEETVRLAENALAVATAARREALRLKESAVTASKKAEEAIPSAQDAFDKISGTIDEIMRKQLTGKGSLYFIQADLDQSRKYLPKTRFIVAQKRASRLITPVLQEAYIE